MTASKPASSLLVTGATGLIGTALAARRTLVGLPRQDPGTGPWWEPAQGRVHDRGQRFDAVVHLAGAGIADKRWNPKVKAVIRDSRVQGTRTLVQWLAGLPEADRPRTLVAGSAIGFYGDRGDDVLTEASSRGEGFLAQTCDAWEEESRKAADLGVRVVIVRTGIVLSTDGGAFDKMLPAFRLGGGGPMGSGQQWFPWIHIDDLVRIIEHALDQPTLHGVVNAAAPGIVRQGEFATALGAALNRPAVVPVPAFALKLAMGPEMAQELLLASARVTPARLAEEPAFAFRYPDLPQALTDLVG